MTQQGEGRSEQQDKESKKHWIEVEFTIDPPTPVPSRGPSSYPTYVLIDGSPQHVDLDKGGLHRVDSLDPATVPVGLRMPKFGEEKTAEIHQGDVDEDVKARATDKRYSYVIHNEVPEVAKFMSSEMTTNAASAHAAEIKALIESRNRHERLADAAIARGSLADRITAAQHKTAADVASARAKAKYFFLVNEYTGDWNHKPTLKKKWGAWHTWGAFEYFYDPWSNIHYGYVGRAAGFTKEELVKGASQAQQMVDFGGSGDPDQDVIAIKKGCDLFDTRTAPTATILIGILESTPGFLKRARSHNSYESKKSIIPK